MFTHVFPIKTLSLGKKESGSALSNKSLVTLIEEEDTWFVICCSTAHIFSFCRIDVSHRKRHGTVVLKSPGMMSGNRSLPDQYAASAVRRKELHRFLNWFDSDLDVTRPCPWIRFKDSEFPPHLDAICFLCLRSHICVFKIKTIKELPATFAVPTDLSAEERLFGSRSTRDLAQNINELLT